MSNLAEVVQQSRKERDQAQPQSRTAGCGVESVNWSRRAACDYPKTPRCSGAGREAKDDSGGRSQTNGSCPARALSKWKAAQKKK
jgi:hypothetical protein